MGRKPPSRLRTAILTFLGLMIVRLLMATVRKEYVNFHYSDEALADSKTGNVIYAIWHGRILLATCTHRKAGLHILVSLHRDGRLIASIAEKLGYKTIAGSTTRGGAEALRRMLELLGEGKTLVITPDGPRGPRFSVGEGCIFLAQKSGVPIIPAAFSPSRFWQARSWDGMLLPKPFSKIRIALAPPIWIGPEMTGSEMEKARNALRIALLAVTKESDAAVCKRLPEYERPDNG